MFVFFMCHVQLGLFFILFSVPFCFCSVSVLFKNRFNVGWWRGGAVLRSRSRRRRHGYRQDVRGRGSGVGGVGGVGGVRRVRKKEEIQKNKTKKSCSVPFWMIWYTICFKLNSFIQTLPPFIIVTVHPSSYYCIFFLFFSFYVSLFI